jgi:hypothetical protein
MVMVAPGRSRVLIEHGPGLVRAVVRVRRNWGLGIFLAAWVCGWSVGEVVVIRQLATRSLPGPGLAFLALWLAAWTVGGAVALLQLLWIFAGREEIELGPRSLAVRTVAGPLRRTREYDLAEVRNPREDVSMAGAMLRSFQLSVPAASHGAIVFDYGAKAIRIGAGLEGEDVQKVLGMLRERLPADAPGF